MEGADGNEFLTDQKREREKHSINEQVYLGSFLKCKHNDCLETDEFQIQVCPSRHQTLTDS